MCVFGEIITDYVCVFVRISQIMCVCVWGEHIRLCMFMFNYENISDYISVCVW